jgi:hypothetical protein
MVSKRQLMDKLDYPSFDVDDDYSNECSINDEKIQK